MENSKKYCLDANVFIEGWNKYYSMDLCPSYWEIIDSLAQEKQVFSPIEVKKEILKLDDGLATWIKTRPHIFRDITIGVQENVRTIMQSYPRLVDSIRQRSMADPWVIAFAMEEDAIVVTKENPAGPNSSRIKIPDVCVEMQVPWMDDFRFAKEIGIEFQAVLKE